MKNVVIYHKNCLDGIFSAGVVFKFLKTEGEESISFVPMSHSDGFDMGLLDNETVLWIVDFSFSYDDMKIMNDIVHKMYWYDHHISSQGLLLMWEDLNKTTMSVDLSHCGAHIAWSNLFPVLEVPKCILFVEDRDLWKFKYPETKKFTESLASYPNLQPDSDIVQDLFVNSNVDKYIIEGEVLLRAKEKRIERAINNGYYGTIKKHNAFFVNAIEDISEIGERIYKSNIDPIVAVVYHIEENTIKFSLRSNTIDVEQIARDFKGGGHISAAGFVVNTRLEDMKKILR